MSTSLRAFAIVILGALAICGASVVPASAHGHHGGRNASKGLGLNEITKVQLSFQAIVISQATNTTKSQDGW